MRGTPCLDGGLQKKSQLISSAVKAGRKKKETVPAEWAAAAARAVLAALVACSASTGPPASPRPAVQQRHHADPAGQNGGNFIKQDLFLNSCPVGLASFLFMSAIKRNEEVFNETCALVSRRIYVLFTLQPFSTTSCSPPSPPSSPRIPTPPPACQPRAKTLRTINQPLATAGWDSVTLGSVCRRIERPCPRVTLTLPI